MDAKHRRLINEWQARYINKVIEYFYTSSPINQAAIKFGPVYGKLAQGLVDKGCLTEFGLRDIANQIPQDEWEEHLFWIARDCMPRSKRPPHYTEES